MSAPPRVAILADVHGILPAFEAVAADVEAVGADRVIVNGDMVNRGPQSAEVLGAIHARGWEMLLGNHDDLLLMWTRRDATLPPSWFEDPFWASTGWCAAQVDAAGWGPTLAALPTTTRIEVAGLPSVLVAHGSPRHYREGYGRHLSDAAISEIVEMHPYDVLVGSHTHIQMERRWGRHLVLNSGAVGTPFDGDARAQYLVLHGEGDRWRPEFRRVAYDREAALAAFVTSGYLAEAGLSARLYQAEVAVARSLLVPFQMWSETHDAPRDEAAWHRFRRAAGRSLRAPDAVGAEAVAASGLTTDAP